MRKSSISASSKLKKLDKKQHYPDKFEKAVDELLRTEEMCHLCEEGGPLIVFKLSDLLKNDPK